MTRLKDDARGFSIRIATLMTIVVLLVLGCVMYVMVVDVTPSDTPAWGALASTRNGSGNYTIRVIALTNNAIERDVVSVILHPDNSTISIGKITGNGNRLSCGDTFTMGNLQPGATYTVLIMNDMSGSIIASLNISAC